MITLFGHTKQIIRHRNSPKPYRQQIQMHVAILWLSSTQEHQVDGWCSSQESDSERGQKVNEGYRKRPAKRCINHYLSNGKFDFYRQDPQHHFFLPTDDTFSKKKEPCYCALNDYNASDHNWASATTKLKIKKWGASFVSKPVNWEKKRQKTANWPMKNPQIGRMLICKRNYKPANWHREHCMARDQKIPSNCWVKKKRMNSK